MQDKRDFLFDILPKNCICAEIGVWKGEFSQKILNHLNPKKLYLIDKWRFESKYDHSWYGGLEAKNQQDMNDIYDKVVQKFRFETRIKILAMTSSDASATFSENYFDFVYIDGNHLYEFVKQDLELFYSKIKNDGFIVGDDYGVNGWWNDGITKAVNEFVETNLLILSVKNNQFIIEKGK